MEYVALSNNCELSKVVFGCMRIKEAKVDGNGLMHLVESCLDMGITSFDHAPVYGGYTCQQFFGDNVLRKNPLLRKKIKIISKAGITLPNKRGNKVIYYDSRKETIFQEVDETLAELGTDYLDLLLIHRPDVLADPASTGEALDSLIKNGKVLSVGVSNYLPFQVDALQSKMKNKLAANQVELSVKNVEHFFDGITDDSFKRDYALMAWSPMGGGAVFREDKFEQLRQVIGDIAQGRGTTADSIIYSWLFTHPARMMAITGTMNVDRLKRAVEAVSIKLSYDEWYSILAASRGYDVP